MHKLHCGCDYRVSEHHQFIEEFRVVRYVRKAYMFRLRWKIRCITIDQLNLLIVRTAIRRQTVVVIQIVACSHCSRCTANVAGVGANTARRRRIDQFIRHIVVTAAHAICDGCDRCWLENSICWMLECYCATRSIQSSISGHRVFTNQIEMEMHANTLVGIFVSFGRHLSTATRQRALTETQNTSELQYNWTKSINCPHQNYRLLLFISENETLNALNQIHSHTISIHLVHRFHSQPQIICVRCSSLLAAYSIFGQMFYVGQPHGLSFGSLPIYSNRTKK